MAKVTLYVFLGILDDAGIEGDLSIDDVSCPYCQSSGSCAHLLACIDPLNFDVGGRLQGLDQEFIYRITKAFLPHLIEGARKPSWGDEEISELWQGAKSNWSPGDDEIAIDEIVLFRLISTILENAAEHSDYGSQLEGFGTETEYTLVYDTDPTGVLNRSIEALDRILTPKKRTR